MLDPAKEIQGFSPIWGRIVHCPNCKKRPERHRGQREGVRHYTCSGCGRCWAEPPVGWHALVEGRETVIPVHPDEGGNQFGSIPNRMDTKSP